MGVCSHTCGNGALASPPSRTFAMSTLVGSLCERPPCLPRTDMPQVFPSGLSCPPAPPTSVTPRLGFAIRFKVAIVLFTGCTGGTAQLDPSLTTPLIPDTAHDSTMWAGYFESVFFFFFITIVWYISYVSSWATGACNPLFHGKVTFPATDRSSFLPVSLLHGLHIRANPSYQSHCWEHLPPTPFPSS